MFSEYLLKVLVVSLAVNLVTSEMNFFNMTDLPLIILGLKQRSLRCNQVTNQKNIIIHNPASVPGSCTYTIVPNNRHICQIRIDFDVLTLKQPTLNPMSSELQCTDHVFIKSLRSENLLSLCGENSGQHFYFHLNGYDRTDKLSISFQLNSGWSNSKWQLKVKQLECPLNGPQTLLQTFFDLTNEENFNLLAPTGCHQFHTSSKGQIKSFNFNPSTGSLYPPKMNYVICFKGAYNTKAIKYLVKHFSFALANANAYGYDSDCKATIHTAERAEDFLMMPKSWMSSKFIQPTLYCGTSLKANDFIVAAAPFMIYFSSDAKTTTKETGFNFDYQFCTSEDCSLD